MDIKSFSGEYSFLSNFYPAKVIYMGVLFPTVEHAYVAAKNPTRDFVLSIAALPVTKAAVAKKMGQRTKIRSDWDQVKLSIMETLLRQKFNEGELQKALIGTDNDQLIEGNWWHDNFWGGCNCKKCTDIPKYNHLGKLLMQIRSDLTNELVTEITRFKNENM
jgi:ribA/ribD-fused uncharacterized protein